MLSGCQHAMIKNMITERHNKACRIVLQALAKGNYGANLFYTDAGSADRFADEGMDKTNVANRSLPAWLLNHISDHGRQLSSRPDAIFVLPSTTCSTQFTSANSALNHFSSNEFDPSHWEVHLIEFKYCEDTRPHLQLKKAQEQHERLITRLNDQRYKKVRLHTILTGAMGTIYKKHTHQPLNDLGMDFYQTNKLTRKLTNILSSMPLN